MAYLIPMLTPLTAEDVSHRLGADCGIKYFMFRQPKTLTLSKLASACIPQPYLATWLHAGYDQKIDSQNYYPFVFPHKPFIQHFLVLVR